MKKLLLLFIAVTAFSCSTDEPEPTTINVMDGISLNFVSKHCIDDSCTLIYEFKNDSQIEKIITAEFTFNQYDTSNEGQSKVKIMHLLPNMKENYVLGTDADTEVLSYEIINVELYEN